MFQTVSLYQNGRLVETKKSENVFKFAITLEAENQLEVKAGECTASCVIYKVDKNPKEYYLKKGDSSNWM